ncbi:Domain of unknown function DUF1983 [uncultured Caudovirales phage]|uniref:Tip attachment protein J central straight fiber domain-containing protein n=1 Tax=uncultured Caudovirales phage TaxID=2100421 RepID=A0A6J5KJS0_9CAUD|nr:Domain of unknown function DUF1983 [uncultured Caudovirales phage]
MATSNTKQGVPGIPLGALDAIADENTRQVLRAIVDGWHVRNGNAGSGDNAFITRGELTGLSAPGASAQNLIGAAISGEVGRALDQLHTRVFESRLFKALGTRIDLIDTSNIHNGNTITQEITNRANADNAIYTVIDTQVSAINGNIAGLQSSQTTIANNVAALSSTVTTLQATVGSNSAAISAEATARANADGDLYAQYTLRVDVNGRVSGFGLASDANSSDFIIRADRFSIVSPTGNYAALIMTNNTINVYDENGVLRVKLGRLS